MPEDLGLTLAANIGAKCNSDKSAIIVTVSGNPILQLTQHAAEGLSVALYECSHEMDVKNHGN